jgi:hypothetical protein
MIRLLALPSSGDCGSRQALSPFRSFKQHTMLD